jgi:NAD(P)-dependent dehydrogenase (short-subunit alcohol dehydrogenase family)
MSMERKNRAEYNFSGRKALVTGASKGIGKDIALAFAAAKADICATARQESELALLAQEIEDYGVECWSCTGDLSDVSSCRHVAQYFLEHAGRIDILVNNAGISYTETLFDLDFDHWDKTLAVNLRAPALIGQTIAKAMAQQGEGIIINVASNAGIGGISEHAAYCASKFGLLGLTKVMAIELGPLGIRVNAIAPTVVLTPMGMRVWGDPAKADPVKAKIPLNRFAYPEEITDTVLFLASGSSSMIHGETIIIDGGAHARLY